MKRYLTLALAVCLACVLVAIPAARTAFAENDSFGSIAGEARADSASDVAREDSASNRSGRMYGIGSVSKVYTAAAVLKLVDEGLIDLDTPLVVYIPEFRMADARYTQITPRMLLNHSAGFRGFTPNNSMTLGVNSNYYHDHFLESLQSQTLKHDPGDRSIYCNDAFTLAEILVEHASGMSFTEYLEQSFFIPLELEDTKTTQSDFDHDLLAGIYLGNNEMQPEMLNAIGTGGIFATMEDLCRFSTLFMDSADGSILSDASLAEMARIQQRNAMVPEDADSVIRYGLGWDSIDPYPFNQWGISAMSKGGDSLRFHTNLTVVPEYNLAVAVSASGSDNQAQLIAQEIILAILIEEGLLPPDTVISMPALNLERVKVPESMHEHAGLYDGGIYGVFSLEFTEYSLILTPLMVRNELPQEYLYNTDGLFVSMNGDYFGPRGEGSRGFSELSFAEDGYLIAQTYRSEIGLSTTATAYPVAQRLEANVVPESALEAWAARNGREYLLVSEMYLSAFYLSGSMAKTMVDERVGAYVAQGIYRGGGMPFSLARIVDESTACGFQDIPAMAGRDTTDLRVSVEEGVEYLHINDFVFIDAAAAVRFSELGETVVLESGPIWADIDSAAGERESGGGGQVVHISAPTNGAWFVYDENMNCIATSLERHPRTTVILPQGGRVAFTGEPGATFTILDR